MRPNDDPDKTPEYGHWFDISPLSDASAEGSSRVGEYRKYVEKLSEVSGVSISNFAEFVRALAFVTISSPVWVVNFPTTELKSLREDYTQGEIDGICNKVYGGHELSKEENSEIQIGDAFRRR